MNRIVPGILLAIGWLLLLALGSFQLFWGAMVLIGFLGSREYCRMAFADHLYESDRVLLPLILILPILGALFCRQSPVVVPAGLVLGQSQRMNRLFSPLIYIAYPIPKVVLLPIFLLLLGIGNSSKIALIALRWLERVISNPSLGILVDRTKHAPPQATRNRLLI